MIRINLLKEEPKAPIARKAVIKEKKPIPMSFLLGLFVIAAVAVGFFQFNALRKERNLLNEVEEEKNKLKDVVSKLETVKAQQAMIVRKIDLINQLKSQQGVAVDIMDELSKHIPYWVWLTEVTYSMQSLQIRGTAIDNNLISDYIYNLETSPYFSNVELQSSTRREARDGSDFYNFSMTAKLVSPMTATPSTKPEQKGR